MSKTPPLSVIIKDPSIYSLLFANLVTVYLSFNGGLSLIALIFVYWFQSITIGIINFIRMISLKKFSTEGLASGDKPVPADTKTKRSVSFFFLAHYGLFHVLFFVFIYVFLKSRLFGDFSDWVSITMACLVFLVNHGLSFINEKRNLTKEMNLGFLMFYPYARILPLHLTFIFGVMFMLLGLQSVTIVIFIAIKIVIDLFMQVLENNLFSDTNIHN